MHTQNGLQLCFTKVQNASIFWLSLIIELENSTSKCDLETKKINKYESLMNVDVPTYSVCSLVPFQREDMEQSGFHTFLKKNVKSGLLQNFALKRN